MDSLDKETVIDLLTSKSFEKLIEYTDIINLLHNHPNKYDELITFMLNLHKLRFDCDDLFMGYLVYKSIINNDDIAVTQIRNSKYFSRKSLIEVINLAYSDNNWNIILSNTWIINNHHQIALLSKPILFVIDNYHYFDIDCVWESIINSMMTKSSAVAIEIFSKCIELDLPQLSDRIPHIFKNCTDEYNNVPISDFILSHGFQPPPELITNAFDSNDIEMIKLFVKYNVDIKQICDIKSINKWSKEMIHLTAQLGIDFETYLHLISMETKN